jgi:hypothetical protein
MPLDLQKLENVVELGDDGMRARCPACGEGGGDRKGEHLRIYPDGRFGCCVAAGDREHRKRIFALAGKRDRNAIELHITPVRSSEPILSGIWGRLGGLFPRQEQNVVTQEPLTTQGCDGTPGTLGTGPVKSKRNPTHETLAFEDLGTLGTPAENSHVERRVITPMNAHPKTPIDFSEGVPSVLESQETEEPHENVGKPGQIPYLTPDGTLVIPFDAPERYHYWNGGQSVRDTMAELQCTQEPETAT